MNLASKILAVSDLKTRKLTIPEWDATVIIRGMTAAQRGRFIQSRESGLMKASVELIIDCTFDENMRPVFEKSHRDALMERNGHIIEHLGVAIMELSGLDAPAWAVAEKNSETASDDSISSSPKS